MQEKVTDNELRMYSHLTGMQQAINEGLGCVLKGLEISRKNSEKLDEICENVLEMLVLRNVSIVVDIAGQIHKADLG